MRETKRKMKMKKLMFVLATVAVAACAQAASVDWSYTITKATQDQYASGYTAYLFDKATWDAAVLAGVTADTWSSALDSSVIQYKSKGMGTANYNYATTDGTTVGAVREVSNSGWTAGETGNFYYVLVNGNTDPSQYMATAATLTYRGDLESDNGTGTSSATSTAIQSATWNNVAGGSGGGGSGGVPEPTSGLLLVLGGAMLALRRRRR